MFVDRGCKLAIAQLLVLFRELNEHLGKNRQAGGTLRLSCFFGGWWYDVLRCLGKQKSNGRRGSAGLLKVRLQLVADFLDHPTPASVRMVTATLWNLKVNSWQNLCKAWAVSPDRPASVRTLILTYVITTSLFHFQWWFSTCYSEGPCIENLKMFQRSDLFQQKKAANIVRHGCPCHSYLSCKWLGWLMIKSVHRMSLFQWALDQETTFHDKC